MYFFVQYSSVVTHACVLRLYYHLLISELWSWKIRGINGERDEELFDVLASSSKRNRKRQREIEKFRKIRRGQGNLRDVSLFFIKQQYYYFE